MLVVMIMLVLLVLLVLELVVPQLGAQFLLDNMPVLYGEHQIVLCPSEVPADGCLIVGDNRYFHVWLLLFLVRPLLGLKCRIVVLILLIGWRFPIQRPH